MNHKSCSLEAFRQRKAREMIQERISEKVDYFRFEVLPRYRDYFAQCDGYRIELEDVSVVIAVSDHRPVNVALDFPRSRFRLHDVLDWLAVNRICCGCWGDEQVISQAGPVVEAVCWDEYYLILLLQGQGRLNTADIESRAIPEPEKLVFIGSNERIYCDFDEEPDKIQFHIVMNGRVLDEIPYLEFDKEKDIIIVNDVFVVADYMDVFEDGLALFLYGQPEPLLMQTSLSGQITIDIIPDGADGRLITVKC